MFKPWSRVRAAYVFVLLAASVCPGVAQQARVTTKDGNVFVGAIEPVEKGVYGIQTSYGLIRIPASSVRQIEMLDASQPNAAPPSPQPTPLPAAGQASGAAASALAQGKLRLAGSNTIGAKLILKLLEGYAAGIGDNQIRWVAGAEPEQQSLIARGSGRDAFLADVSAHGSSTAFTALASGAADIGMASRAIKPEEIQQLAALGLGDFSSAQQEHVLALDGVAVLINAANPLSKLSLAQIADIFSGAKKDWSDFGGKPGPIAIYSRDDKSGTFDTFKTLVLQDRKLDERAKRFESNEDLSDAVAANANGIGFASLAYIRNAKPLAIATDCGLEFSPSEFLVKTEDYPLSRRLFLYSRSDDSHAPFIEYALSAAAQKTIADAGFINLAIGPSEGSYIAARFAHADREAETRAEKASTKKFDSLAQGGVRLSVAFRFKSGTATLDSRAVRDIDRLVDVLKQPAYRDRQIALAGFSDSVGQATRNMALSRDRAEAVASALRKRGATSPVAVGFGAAAPVACDTTPQGLEKNRRVEVWIR